MARANNKASETNYIEFDFTATNKNDFKGRIYKDAKAYDKGTAYGVSITINGVTIKGAKLWMPSASDKEPNFMWPSYKANDGKYYDYIAFFEDGDRCDVAEAAKKLGELVK